MNDKVGRKEEMTKRRDGRKGEMAELAGMAEMAGMSEMTSMAKFVGSEGCPATM